MAAQIANDARPTIVDAPLTLIFRMRQGAFGCLLPEKQANSTVMNGRKQSPRRLPMIQDRKSLTLR